MLNQGQIRSAGFNQGTVTSQCSQASFCCLGEPGCATCTGCFAGTFPSSRAGWGRAVLGARVVSGDVVFRSSPQPHPCFCPRYSQPCAVFFPNGEYPVLFLKVHCIKAVKCILKFYDFQILIGILHNISAAFLETRLYGKFLLFLMFLPAIQIQLARRN